MSTPSPETIQLLTIMQWPGLGPVKAREVARALLPGGDVLQVARRVAPSSAAKAAQHDAAVDAAVDKILEECARCEIQILSLIDDAYPCRLKSIADAPPVLFVKGRVEALSSIGVAVVGTREASPPGRRAAHMVAEHFAKAGVTVVSGLALGIDTAAHEGALAGKGPTVAVLAHGLDTVAPTSNKKLATAIVDGGGALISEHPPGVPPRPPEFARRNRIQSGMSVASVVVESGSTGGAMIQAGFTKQQGRTLFAVVSKDPSFRIEGAQRLQAEFGAIPIAGLRDLRRAISEVASLPSTEQAAGTVGEQGELEWT